LFDSAIKTDSKPRRPESSDKKSEKSEKREKSSKSGRSLEGNYKNNVISYYLTRFVLCITIVS
jgi:hypothetical protein